jgi:hypothetical protein
MGHTERTPDAGRCRARVDYGQRPCSRAAIDNGCCWQHAAWAELTDEEIASDPRDYARELLARHDAVIIPFPVRPPATARG